MWHVRENNANLKQVDLNIIHDVYTHDCYKAREIRLPDYPTIVDVGACIGSFARLACELWPNAKVMAIEANKKNISFLKANCPNAAVMHAALTYEPEPALLDAVWDKGNSGGSIVKSREQVLQCTDKRYLKYVEPLPVMTLERLAVARIDLLKLDCEGSEYNIIEHTSILDNIEMIIGEYHGGEERFRDMIKRRLPDRKLTIWRQHLHMGLFWIAKD